MAFCSNCGKELATGAKFCFECGTPVAGGTTASSTERRTVYDGEIHKCPNCGDTIDAYESVCETCGYEIRGRVATSVAHELVIKLEKIDNVQKKAELIQNFYIPNTKEDIYEFIILASSNIKVGGENARAWFAKLEQAYQKAILSFGNTKDFNYCQQLYITAQRTHRINFLLRLMKSGYFWALLVSFTGLIMNLLADLFDNPDLGLTGMLPLVGGGLIAIITATNNEEKKKRK